MDAVYLWVNGEDSERAQRFARYKAEAEGRSVEDVGIHRFSDHGELKYSLRSLELNAPWVERVFVVTDGQRPPWLRTESGALQIVAEGDLFPNKAHLPTFNSVAVDSHLHRIPGISKTFLYLNDDFFIGQPIQPTDFETSDGATVVYQGSLGFFGKSKIVDFGENPEGKILEPADQANLSKAIGSWIPSLQNGAELLDREYGPALRRSIAHSPFLIDAEWMEEMQRRWPQAFERTSSNRFRCNDDFHVQFMYYNYLIAEGARNGRFKTRPLHARADPKIYQSLHAGTNVEEVRAFFAPPSLPKFSHIATLRDMTKEVGSAVVAGLERHFPKRSRFE